MVEVLTVYKRESMDYYYYATLDTSSCFCKQPYISKNICKLFWLLGEEM